MNEEMTVTQTVIFDADKMKSTRVTGDAKTWTTWEGKEKKIGEIDHQHLSNIYWFNLLLYNRVYEFVIEELKRRFDSTILPYRPDIRFANELKSLEKKGYLKWESLTTGLVKFDGKIIGEVVKK